MSRINHSCEANSNPFYDDYYDIEILIANRDILDGEEITMSYIIYPSQIIYLESKWGFKCICDLCSTPKIEIWKEIERLQKELSKY
jgi:SET domain-containing protein